MKKIRILSAVLLLCSVPVLAAPKAAPKIDPATYTIPIHVSAARYDPASMLSEVLSGVIAGKHYEIECVTHGNGLLNPGDYLAKLTEDTHKSAFESLQVYEILLPDGTTRGCSVIMQAE